MSLKGARDVAEYALSALREWGRNKKTKLESDVKVLGSMEPHSSYKALSQRMGVCQVHLTELNLYETLFNDTAEAFVRVIALIDEAEPPLAEAPDPNTLWFRGLIDPNSVTQSPHECGLVYKLINNRPHPLRVSIYVEEVRACTPIENREKVMWIVSDGTNVMCTEAVTAEEARDNYAMATPDPEETRKRWLGAIRVSDMPTEEADQIEAD